MLYQNAISDCCKLSFAYCPVIAQYVDSQLLCVTVQGRALSLLVWCGLYVDIHQQDNMTLQGYCIGAVQSTDNTTSINAQ